MATVKEHWFRMLQKHRTTLQRCLRKRGAFGCHTRQALIKRINSGKLFFKEQLTMVRGQREEKRLKAKVSPCSANDAARDNRAAATGEVQVGCSIKTSQSNFCKHGRKQGMASTYKGKWPLGSSSGPQLLLNTRAHPPQRGGHT